MTAFRFEFQPTVNLTEAEMSLHLALFAVEGLFGEARVRLEASYHLNAERRALVVHADNEVGLSLVQVYTRLLIREFGEEKFHVRRVDQVLEPLPAAERTIVST